MYEKDFPIYSKDFCLHNIHWISAYGGFNGLSPYYADSNYGCTFAEGNCVPFVYGYWHCLGNCTKPKELKLSPYNANSFYGYDDGYERSKDTPKVGAIACWDDGKYGHVAIVIEVLNGGKTIRTLNSAYQSTVYYERVLNYPFNFGRYDFQGFIYCPFIEPNPVEEFKLGDAVLINGDLYKSSMADYASGYIKDRVTKITRIASGAKHPYNTTGDLGWMNESDIKPYEAEVLKVGDKVEPIKNVSYSGNRVVRWDDYYYITELSGQRAVLSAKRNGKMVVWCAMNVNNLRKVG